MEIAADAGAESVVVNLEQLPADVSVAGGKAASLARMIRAGLPVPHGYCITTHAFRRFIAGVDASVLQSLETVSASTSEEIVSIAAQLRQLLQTAPIPADITTAILAAWQSRGADLAYAVRSSATAEDLADASFAGQHDTLLNVRGRDALLDAVRRCWISLFSDRAVLYRVRNHVSHRDVAMAVIVQELVLADTAGVLFTADPVTGDTSRVVIEATPGLGESLVSGHVSPDRVVLEKLSLRVIERQTNRKTTEIVPDSAGGVRERPVESGRLDAPCLTDSQAQLLGELALRAERDFGAPQDIEWALVADRMFLLQARPITVLPSPAPAGPGKRRCESFSQLPTTSAPHQEPDIWSTANIGEIMPDVLTPMSWAVLQFTLDDLLHPILRRIGIDTDERPSMAPIAGRAYANITTFVSVLQSMPGPTVIDLTEILGGHHADVPEHLLKGNHHWNLRRLARLACLAPWLLVHSSNRAAKAFGAQWHARADELDKTDFSSMPDQELASHIPRFFAKACHDAGSLNFTGGALGTIGFGLGCAMGVFHYARRWLGDTDASIANRLFSGVGAMSSAEAGLDLSRLAAWVRTKPALRHTILQPGSFGAALLAFSGTEDGREFLERWRAFMKRHGHHTRGEMDVHNPRWSETPDYVLDMLRGCLRLEQDSDPLRLQEQRAHEREQLLADCLRRLRNPLKRRAFAFFVRKGQQGVALRENVKSDGVRMVATVRRALHEAGRRLVQRGRLRTLDEVFFLKPEEIGPALAGEPTLNLPATIDARLAEYAYHRSLNPPPVIVGEFDPATCVTEASTAPTGVLKGLAVSPGVVTGPARVILRADADHRVLPGEILVAPFTDPGWTPYFLTAAAIVMDMGGQLSHGSVVAREYGIPAVVNVGPATKLITTGQLIRVDGNRGTVTILSEPGARGDEGR